MTEGVTVEVATRKASARSPILSLVDQDFMSSVANIPRQSWEPLSYLASEMEKAVARVEAMEVPPELEWVKASCLNDWAQVEGWIRHVLTKSQSVDALRSWQLMGGLQAGNPQRPSTQVVMPDFPQPSPPGGPKKQGVLRRSKA